MTWWAQLLLTLAKPFAKLMAALGLYAKGRSDANLRNEVEAARASIEAERKRRDLDDQIAADTDLADRARRIGLVRPGRE
jgi:hypothetical protein